MVKPDVKHNYYADLELPNSASAEDIKRAYKKLALQFHPDRNAGREDECVSKFQAINTAHEVLNDPALKTKYDHDRRKAAGQYPYVAPRQPTPGNPYAATSAWAPPPRRTQPGAYQRPPGFGPPPAAGPNGAERFSNFPRPTPTAKKDPAQDRTNMFRAWQNMNSQERQQRPNPPNPQAPPPQPPPQTPLNRPRPPPPPRQEPNMPSEEQIRAGMRYKHAPPYEAENAQSAWSAFQQANAGRPGMARSNTMRTPKRAGFNPNAPGSDERAAPGAQSHHSHRKSSEGFVRPGPRVNVPPTSAPQPPGTAPTTPLSPQSPRSRRPYDEDGNQVPFAEGNRHRTPYTSFIGEKTDFSGEGLRRSYSTHGSTRQAQDGTATEGRARSSSPRRTAQNDAHHASHQDPFDRSNSNGPLENEADISQADEADNTTQGPPRPGTAPISTTPFARPSNDGPYSPPPKSNMPHTAGATNGTQPGMQQKSSSNMYADPHSSFNSQSWTARNFGSYSTSSAEGARFEVPKWAIPSSINPAVNRKKHATGPFVPTDELFKNATEIQQNAYLRFASDVLKEYENEYVPTNLDMDVFLKLVGMARMGQPSGAAVLDRLLARLLLEFPSVSNSQNNTADEGLRANSFSWPHDETAFQSANARSRSEENINTNFSPEGFKGTFTGEPEYFDQPTNADPNPSPVQRTANAPANAQPRSATLDEPPTSVPPEGRRPWGSDGFANQHPRAAAGDGVFDSEKYESVNFFQEPSYTQPAHPVRQPSPVKGGATPRKASQGRRAGKAANKKAAGSKHHPHVVDEEEVDQVDSAQSGADSGAPTQDEGDAMDLDTPPAQATEQEKDARLYSMPRSAWRHEQEQKMKGHPRKTSTVSRRQRGSVSNDTKFHSELDDLRNVEPIGQSADKDGINVSDLGSSLPFPSQASGAAFSNVLKPQYLKIPDVPVPPQAPQKLTKSSWHAHAAAFGEYVKAFHEFNKTLLQHFASREMQVQEQINSTNGWLEATGDTSGMVTAPTGFGTYLRGIKEDERVRETWNLASERHADAVKGFDSVRERVRRIVIGGGLADF